MSGAVVFTGERRSDVAGVVPSVGRLACELRTALGDTPPTDPRLVEQTGMSPSVEADHEAIEGAALVNRGRYDEGIKFLQRAVALDPAFTTGHSPTS